MQPTGSDEPGETTGAGDPAAQGSGASEAAPADASAVSPPNAGAKRPQSDPEAADNVVGEPLFRRKAAAGTQRRPASEASGPAAPAEAAQPRRARQAGGKGKGRKAPPRRQAPTPYKVLPTAPAARRRRHHVGILLSFVLVVLVPIAVAGWYLYTRAADQYASTMGFSIRQEDTSSASEVLGGFGALVGSSTTSDADILYHFIQSQGLVERVDARLDLRALFSRPSDDPVFAISPDASVEELLDYWGRMVTIFYDGTTGLIETRVLAFAPEDAQAISQAIFDESSAVINRLSAIAQEDATQYARDELARAEARLKEARAAMTAFRSRTQMVDPERDIQGQMGLVNNLQAQLAEALIELDLLRESTRDSDPRIRQAEQRIAVIEARIAEEREEFGSGETGSDNRAYATLVGEYEDLAVDREFAEQSYLAARANLDVALAEAQKKTRYLAAYSEPTLAQTSEYPQRLTILGVLFFFAFAAWGVGTLIFYSIRDRR